MQRTILYEVNNLTSSTGTGIATYARALAQSATRLGFHADALFGVERQLNRRQSNLNEVLAFDAIAENELVSRWEALLRQAKYPINALGGIRPRRLPQSGLVMGPVAAALGPFRHALAVTRLVDISMAHFKIFGSLAQVKPSNTPSVFHATHPIPISVKGCPNIYTIHDLVPLRFPYMTLDNKKYFYQLLMKLAAKADHIVTVSEHSRRDILRYLRIDEKRVTNTYQSVDIPDFLLARSDDEVARDLELQFDLEFRGYFLFYGAIEPKKNVSRLVDAYAASGSKRPLIIAGGAGWQNRADLERIGDERFVSFRIDGNAMTRQRRVRRISYLPRDQLVTLIKGARGVLFPSIYEGFGLPVVESMLLGTPVVTSKTSSLPEVAGDAALLVDPYSLEEISAAIVALDQDSDLCRSLSDRGREQAKKFSPALYDIRVRQMYDAVLG